MNFAEEDPHHLKIEVEKFIREKGWRAGSRAEPEIPEIGNGDPERGS